MTEYELEINKTEHDKDDLATYLEYVASQIKQGFTSGEGWDINEVD